jgi:hypothetical protein
MDSGPLTQAQALALLRRTSDDGWLTAELSSPDGTAVINSRTAIAEATSQALQDQVDACLISTAPGGRPGVCVLTLNRQNSGTFIDLPAGYLLRTNDGIDLRVAQPQTVLDTDTTFDLYLETLRSTELVNTYVPAFDALLSVGGLLTTPAPLFDYLIAGVDSFGRPNKVPSQIVMGPGVLDAGHALRYASSTNVTLGASDWLSVHGNERGQRRQAGESVEEYRARIRLFPDAVSPIALTTAAHAAGRNAGLSDVFFLETVNPQVSLDLLAQYSMALADSVFCDDYMDDPIGVNAPQKQPWRSLEMLSIKEGRAYFRIALDGPLNDPDGAVLYLDDGFLDDDTWGYPDGLLAERIMGALLTAPSAIAPLKAAGVQFDYYIENSTVVPSNGAFVGITEASAPAVVWAVLSDPLSAPGSETKAWLYRDGLLAHSPDNAGASSHVVRFTFSDATTFTTATWRRFDSEHLTASSLAAQGFPFKPIVKIEGKVQSDGVTSVTLTGTFWMTEFAL